MALSMLCYWIGANFRAKSFGHKYVEKIRYPSVSQKLGGNTTHAVLFITTQETFLFHVLKLKKSEKVV